MKKNINKFGGDEKGCTFAIGKLLQKKVRFLAAVHVHKSLLQRTYHPPNPRRSPRHTQKERQEYPARTFLLNFASVNIKSILYHEEVLDSFNAASRRIQPGRTGRNRREGHPYIDRRDGPDLQHRPQREAIPSLFRRQTEERGGFQAPLPLCQDGV